MDVPILILLFAANLMLLIVSWCVSQVNTTLRMLQGTTIAIAETQNRLLKETIAELQKANGRIR